MHRHHERSPSAVAPLRIAYVTKGSAHDLGNWSGTAFHIHQALASQGHVVHVVDGVLPHVPALARLRGRLVRAISGKAYLYDKDPLVVRHTASQVEKRLSEMDVDCVVTALIDSAFGLRTNLPVACWADATFHSYMGHYASRFEHVSPYSIERGHRLERETFRKAVFLAFASHWAADDALTYYGVEPDKVAVVPFGANCASPFASSEEARFSVLSKPASPFRMLFIGFEWERKGGPLALGILGELRRRGLNAELWVIGCSPFSDQIPDGVRCLGKLSKSIPHELQQWREAFNLCHIFLMPTRAECFGVVYAEAAAHALPSIASKVGGVPDAVSNGVSGFLFDESDGPSSYCDVLEKLAAEPAKLHELSMSAFAYHQDRLNWSSAGAAFSKLLQRRLHPDAAGGNYKEKRMPAAA